MSSPLLSELEIGTGAFGAVLLVKREGRSLTLREPKPSPPGPLGCLTTPGPVLDENPLADAPSRFGGNVGTGGIPPPPVLPSSLVLPKSALKPA